MINGYLTNAVNLDDRVLHLLFSANRWEAKYGVAAAEPSAPPRRR